MSYFALNKKMRIPFFKDFLIPACLFDIKHTLTKEDSFC